MKTTKYSIKITLTKNIKTRFHSDKNEGQNFAVLLDRRVSCRAGTKFLLELEAWAYSFQAYTVLRTKFWTKTIANFGPDFQSIGRLFTTKKKQMGSAKISPRSTFHIIST